MKCKSWSNKINDFVVRRLKSIKINGQQQQQLQSATAQQPSQPPPPQQQQQYLTGGSTMPAMPKEKATAVSLSESHFSHELKLKELATSSSVVTANTAAVMATTTSRLQHQQQQQHQQQRNMCGCGAASAEVVSLNRNGNNNKYITNGHSTLAAAIAAQNATDCTPAATILSPQRNSNCCRNRSQQHGSSSNNTEQSMPVTPAAVTPPKKSPKDFIFGKYIGEGSFSNVYLAVDVNTKREYAIKVCEKRHILREQKQEYIRREREVMHMMTNVPGFVNLSCTFQDPRSLYFVMTYAKCGDLLPYINKVGSFDVDCTRHYAAELVLACEHMHRRGVVHRDLKPENILLDEDMHTLIADFGSAKVLSPAELASAGSASAAPGANGSRSSQYVDSNYDGADEDDVNDSGSDDVDSPSRRRSAQRYQQRRKGSFVGTAQYVSPEVLQNGPITPAADLWALGCIVYQMISGLPPFRGSNDYVIFKEILACDLDFPSGFDKDAEDLVRQLLKVNPEERLGAQHVAEGRYESIRAHSFFDGIDFEKVREQSPPPIYPYLPGVSKDDDFRVQQYRVPENLEPGLDDRQLTRLLGMELGTALGSSASEASEQQSCEESEKKTVAKNIFDLSDAEKQKRLEQQKSDKWDAFAENEVILKKGYINKRKGLFARKRMLLLTTGPRLIYIDPVQMIKKGEIPWSAELRVDPKNFKIFFVHTPNRTYYLEDPEGYSLEWVDAIENMRKLTYGEDATTPATAATTAPQTSRRNGSPTTSSSTLAAKTASN